MNDFTKEELKILRDLSLAHQSQYMDNQSLKWLVDKIQFMIDYYCDHDQGFIEDSVLIKLCNKCDDIYPIHTEVPNE